MITFNSSYHLIRMFYECTGQLNNILLIVATKIDRGFKTSKKFQGSENYLFVIRNKNVDVISSIVNSACCQKNTQL